MAGPTETVRIYMPPQMPCSPAAGRTQEWVLEIAPGEKQRLDP